MARKSQLPDELPIKEFIDGLYNPEFIPEKVDLNNFLIETEAEEQVRQTLESKKTPNPASAAATDVPVPLTEAEAKEADRQIAATLQRITETRDKINLVRNKIDQQVSASDTDLNFRMDISNKPRIRRAIQRLFGYKTDTITYEMYKELVAAKSQLENEQGEAYANGFPEDTDSDSRKSKRTKKSDSKKSKKKKKDRGFLERNAAGDELDDSSQNEEQYERLFPKIGRDFIYKEDFYNSINGIMNIIDPAGLNPLVSNVRSDSEARKKAKEYKDLLESGKDGSEIYKDLIKLDDQEEEDL